MATFNTKKILYGSPSLIPTIANNLQLQFQAEGYDVTMDALSSGGYDISITKGNAFKVVLGMKTALKITLLPQGNNVYFEAGIGIWGRQVVPLVVMYFVGWPLLITQIWGLVQQSKLDDKALEIAQDTIMMNNATSSTSTGSKFCPYCGTENPADAKFCKKDGKPL